MWPGHMWGDGWMWLFGGLMMLLFWGGLLALAFFAIRAILRSGNAGGERHPSHDHRENSLEILKQRYARGELSREEYLAIRKDLEE
jgi:putative membrane protein